MRQGTRDREIVGRGQRFNSQLCRGVLKYGKRRGNVLKISGDTYITRLLNNTDTIT